MSPENKAHFESEKEAIHLILTGIGDEIYSTVDACKTAHEMWEVIERLQQGESLNIQDVKTNLFWEFGKFTSHDGETMESYYTRFYKMMNEMIRNNLTVATMQVNVQFLQQTSTRMSSLFQLLQQGESLNIQDVKTNLFWEFGKFTSHDGEPIESYYIRFYKSMKETIRKNLTVAMMQVNVKFLQQLQPEWSQFVTIVKQQHKLDEVSYHKLFEILKQYQKEVNELRAERIAKNANPLALIATAQPHQDPYYQTSKSHKSYAPTSKTSLATRSHATTRHKGKEIAKPITPLSESASEEDSDPEQAQKDKEMQKNLALIAKYFKKLYKPTNNNLRTSSNTKNKNVDTTPRYKNDNQTGQFGNQRTITVARARETIGSPVVQQSGIHCFNCKEFGHFAKECRKPKRVKDSMYHKEKMLLCKQLYFVRTEYQLANMFTKALPEDRFHYLVRRIGMRCLTPAELELHGGGGVPFQLKSDSLPHAHAQTTKTYYKHQDLRIKKAQDSKTKTSTNSDINDNSSEIKLRGRLLASFLDDAKYEHVGQDTISQGGKYDQD
ncbi:retrovirus-related pol polyprotein from transposon TNT 1-94 [Tanacetum coccineum]